VHGRTEKSRISKFGHKYVSQMLMYSALIMAASVVTLVDVSPLLCSSRSFQTRNDSGQAYTVLIARIICLMKVHSAKRPGHKYQEMLQDSHLLLSIHQFPD
jgi:hypothetical protein